MRLRTQPASVVINLLEIPGLYTMTRILTEVGMKALIEKIAKSLVDSPEEVSVAVCHGVRLAY